MQQDKFFILALTHSTQRKEELILFWECIYPYLSCTPMTSSDALSFKICSSLGSGSVEVRILELPAYSGFTDFLGKIKDIYGDRGYGLYWVDSEGDEIMVKSIGDYDLALSRMAPAIKFHLNFMPQDSCRHPHGIACHHCKAKIIGFRYKCLTCPAYEQCATCESNGQHSEHRLIRIPKPEDVYSKALFKLLNKSVLSYDKENSGVHDMLNQFWTGEAP
uniref:Sequestosome-1 n=1 Tax=Caligus clemensi TaxID=344056 RepID=C1C0Q8_CALCM|nr:Sequestosome-1 [Caligus clemensi]